MKKLSKSDGPQQMEQIVSVQSSHLAVGSFVVMNNRRGEVKAVLTCKCFRAEKALRIAWEDGSVSIVKPWALNRNGISH